MIRDVGRCVATFYRVPFVRYIGGTRRRVPERDRGRRTLVADGVVKRRSRLALSTDRPEQRGVATCECQAPSRGPPPATAEAASRTAARPQARPAARR